MGHPGPALHQHLQDPLGPELVEHGAGLARHLEGGADPGPGGSLAEDDAQGLVVGRRVDPHGELGVVGPDRAGPHQHGVGGGPQTVDVGPGLVPR